MSEQVPGQGLQLRTLVTASQTVEVSLADVEVAAPRPHQVIVRIEAAPINPSDLGLLFAGADMAEAVTEGTPERPVIAAPLPAAAARAAAAPGRAVPAGRQRGRRHRRRGR